MRPRWKDVSPEKGKVAVRAVLIKGAPLAGFEYSGGGEIQENDPHGKSKAGGNP